MGRGLRVTLRTAGKCSLHGRAPLFTATRAPRRRVYMAEGAGPRFGLIRQDFEKERLPCRSLSSLSPAYTPSFSLLSPSSGRNITGVIGARGGASPVVTLVLVAAAAEGGAATAGGGNNLF